MADVAATELVGVVGVLPSSATKYDLRGTAAIFSLGVIGDITAPTVDGFSPVDGASVSKTTAVTFDVHDETTLQTVFVFVTYGSGTIELIYDGSAFLGGYAATSSTTVIGDGLTFDITPAPHWQDADTEFTIVAFDSRGNKSTTTYSLTITDPPAVDTAAPVVSNPYPALGTTLGLYDEVGADVTDDGPFRRVMLVVEYSGFPDEWVYSGTAFRPWFAPESTATAISGGLRFRVKRFGGWPSRPRLTIIPIDQAGREG